MARNAQMERRLQEWAQWLKVGDGSGYPTMSPLHPQWSPPSAGTTPTPKAAVPSGARDTHRAIGQLSERLQCTLYWHYITNLTVAEQAVRLHCQPDTVGKRVQTAHRALLDILSG
jgi:DNA-directed RNA polymerase specialized sigma24 family protein